MLINLLNNSVKFTSRGKITISADYVDNDIIKITVADTGCGIPEELGSNIFHGLDS